MPGPEVAFVLMSDLMTLIESHVEDFNHGVRTGDFGPMLVRFTPDAELRFEGERFGPFVGRESIAAAYFDQPPDDRIAVESVRQDGSEIVADFRWASEPDRVAGEMRIETVGPQIRRMVVTLSS